jgi:hypothetical protein
MSYNYYPSELYTHQYSPQSTFYAPKPPTPITPWSVPPPPTPYFPIINTRYYTQSIESDKKLPNGMDKKNVDQDKTLEAKLQSQSNRTDRKPPMSSKDDHNYSPMYINNHFHSDNTALPYNRPASVNNHSNYHSNDESNHNVPKVVDPETIHKTDQTSNVNCIYQYSADDDPNQYDYTQLSCYNPDRLAYISTLNQNSKQNGSHNYHSSQNYPNPQTNRNVQHSSRNTRNYHNIQPYLDRKNELLDNVPNQHWDRYDKTTQHSDELGSNHPKKTTNQPNRHKTPPSSKEQPSTVVYEYFDLENDRDQNVPKTGIATTPPKSKPKKRSVRHFVSNDDDDDDGGDVFL